MKQNFTLISLILLFCMDITVFSSLHAQQITPLDLLMSPDKFLGAATGTGSGSGNLNNPSIESAAISAQAAGELDLGTHTTKKRGNLVTFAVLGRANALNSSRIFRRDTFNIGSVSFVDNNQNFNFGIRVRNLKTTVPGQQALISFIGDYSYSKFTITDSLSSPLRFETHSFLVGFHGCYLLNSSLGPIGFSFIPTANYLIVDNVDPSAFKTAVHSTGTVGDQYLGGGVRLLAQFNDFSIFFDFKKYWSLQPGSSVTGLTDRSTITIGGNATGSIVKIKKALVGN